MAEETQHYKTYRLVLDFEVWVNDEILAPYADEEELDEEERQQLTAQRHLLQAILADKQGIYEELLRKRVLVLVHTKTPISGHSMPSQSNWRNVPSSGVFRAA